MSTSRRAAALWAIGIGAQSCVAQRTEIVTAPDGFCASAECQDSRRMLYRVTYITTLNSARHRFNCGSVGLQTPLGVTDVFGNANGISPALCPVGSVPATFELDPRR